MIRTVWYLVTESVYFRFKNVVFTGNTPSEPLGNAIADPEESCVVDQQQYLKLVTTRPITMRVFARSCPELLFF